tara:strand:- start:456 stop:779 length:324 start_codon:yes stop_codon:yes gene_type:complete
MKALKKYQEGGKVNFDNDEPETRREKHARKIEEKHIRRWQRRYKRFRRRGEPAGREAELYATKPWLKKDKPSLGDIFDKLTFRNYRKGPRVTGKVDKECKGQPAWAK